MNLPFLLCLLSSPIALSEMHKYHRVETGESHPRPNLVFPVSHISVPDPLHHFTTPPPQHHTDPTIQSKPEILLFSKRLYAAVDSGNKTDFAGALRKEYKTLESAFEKSKPTLGATLGAFLETRLEDLQASIKQIKTMQGVLDLLNS